MLIPTEIAVCPTCDGELYLEVEEWDEDDVPTESGTRGRCQNWDEECGDSIQARMPYVYWLPVDLKVYRWAKDHVRMSPDPPYEPLTLRQYEVRLGEIEKRKLAEWNAWARGTAGKDQQ